VAQALTAEPVLLEGLAWRGPVSTAVEAQAASVVRAVPSAADVFAAAPDEPAAAQAWFQAALEAEPAYFQVVPV
jgi:hypothetical protein